MQPNPYAPVFPAVDLSGLYAYLDQRFGEIMTSQAEAFAALAANDAALLAAVQDVAADFAALVAAMAVERENLTEAGQAAFDAAQAKSAELSAALAALDTAVGDADGSDTPPPAEGPAPEAPAEEPAPVEEPAAPVEG